MMQPNTKLQLALSFLGVVQAQSAGSASRTTYGNNDLAIDLDNEAVSRNYQDVDIDLISPAFTNPESVPIGFSNGTSGPTPDHELGKSALIAPAKSTKANNHQTTSSVRSPTATTGPPTTAQI